jgi:hypothetical protein
MFSGAIDAQTKLEQEAETRLVQEGDAITFRVSALSLEDNLLSIQWSQSGRSRWGEYVQTAAKFDANGRDAFVLLFVQSALVEDLLADCEEPGARTCTVIVSSGFQWGQDKKTEPTARFLVYHDKSNKPYQHRFVSTSTASRFMIGTEELAEQAGDAAGGAVPLAETAAEAFSDFASVSKSFSGDSLRDCANKEDRENYDFCQTYE